MRVNTTEDREIDLKQNTLDGLKIRLRGHKPAKDRVLMNADVTGGRLLPR